MGGTLKDLDERVLGGGGVIATSRTVGRAPAGSLPLTPEMLREQPSGHLFGMTQDVGMGLDPADVNRPQVLLLSTQGGLREPDGRVLALGYHTGHWELGLLVRAAAETLRAEGVVPFAATCSDPCDGRTQGTKGMFDSLPYRNDAAMTMRRLIRSWRLVGTTLARAAIIAPFTAPIMTTTLPSITTSTSRIAPMPPS